MKILIWGTGYAGRCLFFKLETEKNIDVIGFIETTPKSNEFLNLKVYAYNQLQELEYDFLVIASTFVKEIRDTCEKNGIDMKKVVFLYPKGRERDLYIEQGENNIEKYVDQFGAKYCQLKYNNYQVVNTSIRNFGEDIIYIIKLGDGGAGFFAEYIKMIDALAYADLFHFKPYVWFSKLFPYYEKENFMNTNNPFEYYYQQITPDYDMNKPHNLVSFREVDCEYIMTGINRNLDGLFKNYSMDHEQKKIYIQRAAYILQKYIKFNRNTQVYLEQNVSNLLQDKRTLGVHVRGGDFRAFKILKHPVAVSNNEYITQIKKIMQEYNFEQIFLATDERSTIKEFREEFGDKLVYYQDTYRGDGNSSIAFARDTRENHKYKLGLEVIRDAETLVACNGLVAGLSNISLYAQIKKKALEDKYEYINILDKGVYKESNEDPWAILDKQIKINSGVNK